MKRPFYVSTPRNCYGECLVSSFHNSCQYSLRSVFEPRVDIQLLGKDLTKAEQICKDTNDKHEAEMAAIEI